MHYSCQAMCCLLLPCLLFFLSAQGQQRTLPYEEQVILDASFTGLPFVEAMQEIGLKHGFSIYYPDRHHYKGRVEKGIEGDFKGKTLGDLLQALSSSASLRYSWFGPHHLVFFFGDRLEEVLQSNYIETLSRGASSAAQIGSNSSITAGPEKNEHIQYTHANRERKREITISGKVMNAATKEPILGASIYLEELERGIRTDFEGNFLMRIAPGAYNIVVSGLGFDTEQDRLTLPYDGNLKINLFEKSVQLKEAVVTASAADQQVSNVASGQEKLNITTIEKMPAFLGEVDVIRSITMLPGITTTGEGSGGFQVRGGSADQNLILLDGIPIFQTSHLFGFFSAFHPDLVQEATVYKGSMPAAYGGRVSSILDVRTRAGNQENLKIHGGLGVVSSRLAVEGPLPGKKTTFSAGGRASYSDWILRRVNDVQVRNSRASFYDGQGKIRHRFSDADQLTLTGYLSGDSFKFAADTLYQYESKAASVNWNHFFNNQSHLEVNTFFSQYTSITSGGGEQNAFSLNSDINLYGTQLDFTLPAGSNHEWRAGVSSMLYLVNPGVLEPDHVQSEIQRMQIQQERGVESALFVADRLEISPRLSLDLGLRYSMFHALGPSEVYTYRPDAPKSRYGITDTLRYAKNELITHYKGLEPRFAMRYMLDFYQSVKFSYNRTRQYIHLISNTASITPIDIWKLSNQYVRPQFGDQWNVGYFRNARDGRYEFSAEVYYKSLGQLLEYQDGARLLLNPVLEADLLNARGKAYGAEFMMEKKEGKLTGWLSYTYSRSFRQTLSDWSIEQVNQGNYYPANFDKPHDLTAIGNYQLNRRWSLSANFTYSTGRPTTFADGRYRYDGVLIPDYSARNMHRIPDYHRLDLSITLDESLKKDKKWAVSWVLSVYNVYGRKNAYAVYFKSTERELPGAYKLSILGVPFPSLTYNFRFL